MMANSDFHLRSTVAIGGSAPAFTLEAAVAPGASEDVDLAGVRA
jgi:hypothetical protein